MSTAGPSADLDISLARAGAVFRATTTTVVVHAVGERRAVAAPGGKSIV